MSSEHDHLRREAPPARVVAKRYADETVRTVEGMTRDEVCHRFGSKVQLLARRVHERFSRDSAIQLEDLVSCGAIGLLEAFDRFDGARGVQFTTYAEYRIRGAMYDALRENDNFSRRHRQLARRVQDATDEIRRRHDREPNPEEVAQYLGIQLEDYWAAVDRVKPISHISIDATSDEDGASRTLLDRLISGPSTAPDSGLAIQEVRQALKDGILSLPEKHRQCVIMYYGKGLTLAEIAQVYDVTVSRVSQILSEARIRLRKRLEPYIGADDVGMELPG